MYALRSIQEFPPRPPTPPHPRPLDRVFGILKENNPELTGERRRTTLKPPQVAREGTKKTVFTNFMELCKSMNRNHEHVQAFLLAELGTSGGSRAGWMESGPGRMVAAHRLCGPWRHAPPVRFAGCGTR